MITQLPAEAFDFKPPRTPKQRVDRTADALAILEPIILPWICYIDDQEKAPFTFTGMTADADRNYRPLILRTERRHLGTARGDYTIGGDTPDGTPFAQLFGLERKSIPDAVGTFLGWGERRQRFERELDWLNGRDFAAVVIEGPWEEVLREAESHSTKEPGVAAKGLFRSVLSWQRRFPRVQWQFCPDRRFAEVYCFRQMDAFWNDTMKAAENKQEGGKKP